MHKMFHGSNPWIALQIANESIVYVERLLKYLQFFVHSQTLSFVSMKFPF